MYNLANKDLSNEFEKLRETVDLLVTEKNSLIEENQKLMSMNNQNKACEQLYEDRLRVCMEMALKNSTDHVNCNSIRYTRLQ